MERMKQGEKIGLSTVIEEVMPAIMRRERVYVWRMLMMRRLHGKLCKDIFNTHNSYTLTQFSRIVSFLASVRFYPVY
jgi:hypothetical protein